MYPDVWNVSASMYSTASAHAGELTEATASAHARQTGTARKTGTAGKTGTAAARKAVSEV